MKLVVRFVGLLFAGVALTTVVVTWRESSGDRAYEASCVYYQGTCVSAGMLNLGHFRMYP
jgi:hypothetical protein